MGTSGLYQSWLLRSKGQRCKWNHNPGDCSPCSPAISGAFLLQPKNWSELLSKKIKPVEECSSDILDGTKIFAIKLHYRATLNPKIGEKRNYVRQWYNTKCWQECGTTGTHTYSRNVNWHKNFRKQFGLPGKAERAHFLLPSNSSPTYLGKRSLVYVH